MSEQRSEDTSAYELENCSVTIEGSVLCIRSETGWLLWSRRLNEMSETPDIADVLGEILGDVRRELAEIRKIRNE